MSPIILRLADGSAATTKGKRAVLLQFQYIKLELRNVNFVPSMRLNLLSCFKIDEIRINTQIAHGKSMVFLLSKRTVVIDTADFIAKNRLRTLSNLVPPRRHTKRILSMKRNGGTSYESSGS